MQISSQFLKKNTNLFSPLYF